MSSPLNSEPLSPLRIRCYLAENSIHATRSVPFRASDQLVERFAGLMASWSLEKNLTSIDLIW